MTVTAKTPAHTSAKTLKSRYLGSKMRDEDFTSSAGKMTISR